MSDIQGGASDVVQELPALTRAWRRTLDLPVLVAVVTVAVAVVTTAGRTGWSGLPGILAGPGASAGAAAGAVLLVVSLLVGLPHGAVDLMRPEVLPPGATPCRRRVVTAAYLACALVAVCCWMLVPLPTLLVLLGLAAVHFGTADEVSDRWRRTARTAPSRSAKAIRLITAGGLPVAAPLGLHGDAVRGVLDGLSGENASVVIACARATAVAVLVAAAITCALALARSQWGAAVETAALAALFTTVTPLLAFAVYFGLWHSWRQVARMIAADTVRYRVSAVRALRRFGRCATLPTALTVTVAGVALLAGGRSVLVVGLASVLCLTVPHTIVVARSDRTLRVAGTGPRLPRRPGTTEATAPATLPAAVTVADDAA